MKLRELNTHQVSPTWTLTTQNSTSSSKTRIIRTTLTWNVSLRRLVCAIRSSRTLRRRTARGLQSIMHLHLTSWPLWMEHAIWASLFSRAMTITIWFARHGTANANTNFLTWSSSTRHVSEWLSFCERLRTKSSSSPKAPTQSLRSASSPAKRL